MPPSQPEGLYPEEVKEEKQNEVDPVYLNDVHINATKVGLVACLACVSKKIMQQGSASDKIMQKEVVDSLQEQILASPGTANEPIDPTIMNSFKALVKQYGMSFSAKIVQF